MMIRSVPKLLWRNVFITLTLGLASLTATLPAHAQVVTSTIVAAHSGMCVSVANSSTAQGALIVQMPCTGENNSVWTFVRVGSAYQVIALHSGLCLNVPGNSARRGVQLIQSPCQSAGQLSDQWQLVVEGTRFHLVSVATGLCVNISGHSLESGAPVIAWTCQDSTQLNEQMTVQMPGIAPQIEPSSTDIVAASSGLCVAVSNASKSQSAAIVQGLCDGQNDKTWVLSPVGSNYHVVSKLSGLCLNVPDASTSRGTQLIQSTCQGSANTSDQWRLVPVGTSYQIVAASSGLCVSVSRNSQQVGAVISQWTCRPAMLNEQFDLFTPSAAATTLNSTWTPVIPTSVTPVAVANLPNGKLLMWSANAPYTWEADINTKAGQTYTGIFDPTTGTSSRMVVTVTGADMFCPGTALLPNGTILINGGSSSPKTSLYDPSAHAWSSAANMNIPRGYEGDTPLSNGDVLTLGGSWSGGAGNKTAEIWDPATGWTVLSGVPETNVIGPDPRGVYRGDNHLWLFATSNGVVFHAGPSANMNWITTSGTGTITSAGSRGTDAFSINGNAVMYDIGKILKVGGAPAYTQSSSTPTYAANSAYIIDITGGPNRPVKLTQLPGMNYRRAFSNAVALPDGEVVIIGGQSLPQPFTDTDAVLVLEIWNPQTQQFNMLVPMQIPRTYHSTAILLQDGRVFVGGGGQCGDACPHNHLNAEILSPPYLFNADGSEAVRPVISSAPATARRGSSISVTTQSSVAEFSLMRLSATTHTVNNDQRRVPLSISATTGTTYTLSIPVDSGIALPGYYMLFALDVTGVPSVAVSIKVL